MWKVQEWEEDRVSLEKISPCAIRMTEQYVAF